MKRVIIATILLFSLNSVAGVTPWIDFELEGGHVKIPATIAGIDTYAILDTGAQVNAINSAFIRKHNLTFDSGRKMRINGAFGVEDKLTYNNVPIGFFGIETELDNMPTLSLGYHTNGLLFGSGFFNMFIAQLDYPNHKMRLIKHGSIDMAKLENIEVRKQTSTGMPIVKVGLEDEQYIWLLLDTGNAGGMVVERKTARKLGWLDKLDTKASSMAGANNIITTENFRIPLLKFGPFELENVLVTIPAEGEKSNLVSQYRRAGSLIKGKKVEGVIGYDVLKHFLITIDYKRGNAHIGLPENQS